MKNQPTPKEVIQILMKRANCENANQFAAYLSNKYGVKVSRQQVAQFQGATGRTITHLLLKEALEETVRDK